MQKPKVPLLVLTVGDLLWLLAGGITGTLLWFFYVKDLVRNH